MKLIIIHSWISKDIEFLTWFENLGIVLLKLFYILRVLIFLFNSGLNFDVSFFNIVFISALSSAGPFVKIILGVASERDQLFRLYFISVVSKFGLLRLSLLLWATHECFLPSPAGWILSHGGGCSRWVVRNYSMGDLVLLCYARNTLLYFLRVTFVKKLGLWTILTKIWIYWSNNCRLMFHLGSRRVKSPAITSIVHFLWLEVNQLERISKKLRFYSWVCSAIHWHGWRRVNFKKPWFVLLIYHYVKT